MTESQKQFEEWFDVEKKHFINHEEVFRNVFCQVWQASREAIVVKLPDWSEYDTPRQAIEACKDSLTHAGVAHTYD